MNSPERGHRQHQEQVKNLFNHVSSYYDLMNQVMSLGLHHQWKALAIDLASIQQHHSVLDIACGTGDLTLDILKKRQPASMVSLDLSPQMVEQAQLRFIDEGIINHPFVVSSAEQLPFEANTFHRMIISFGFRNFTNHPKALSECVRCLKDAGSLTILEFSTIQSSTINQLYQLYAQKCIPLMGNILTKDRDSYQYLVDSIESHPDQETVKTLMLEAGFTEVQMTLLLDGLVTIHQGYK